MKENLIIGSHVGFNNKTGLLGSVNETIRYGANTFMFYTGAPQNTKRCAIDEETTNKAHELMKDFNINIENVIVHAPYIVNLGNLEKRDFSIEFLKEEVSRVNKLGIKYMVLHPGSSVNYSKEDSITSIIDGLNEILDNDNNVIICLETMAGKGTELCSNINELKQIIDNIKNKNKIGICLDTCHLFDSGIDLNHFDNYLSDFDKLIGLSYIKCIHINDSKNTLASHKDRHENIGFGNIGFDTLIKIIYHDKLKSIPKILETPYIPSTDKDESYPPYKYEIEMIKNKCFDKELKNKVLNNITK